jgi:ABC-2 type transport system ATP-binding protein
MKPAIVVDQLTKIYPPTKKGGPSFTAVKSVSFQVTPGEIVGLLGPNGAGKSTTISMLLGVLTPSSGSISYFGKNFTDYRSQILQDVTFASTYIRMPWRLSVMENLSVYAYLYGLSREQFKSRTEKFLKNFGVWEQRDKTMNNLSAGQVTRVMLAKAFIPHPKVVLLDEPTASLDPDIAHQIRQFVLEEQKEFGTTMIFTSHNMDEVTQVCDRVIFLKKGQIVAQDTPENLTQSLDDVTLTLRLEKTTLEQISALKLPYQYSVDHHNFQAILPQAQISHLFELFAAAHIGYSKVDIKKPSLEDYFLKLSQGEEIK